MIRLWFLPAPYEITVVVLLVLLLLCLLWWLLLDHTPHHTPFEGEVPLTEAWHNKESSG